jgi:hypothetical protein
VVRQQPCWSEPQAWLLCEGLHSVGAGGALQQQQQQVSVQEWSRQSQVGKGFLWGGCRGSQGWLWCNCGPPTGGLAAAVLDLLLVCWNICQTWLCVGGGAAFSGGWWSPAALRGEWG